MELNIDLLLAHWPFCMAAAVLAVLGLVSDRIFTHARAYRVPTKDFWFWMRETLPAHPIALGMLLGAFMPDPEGHSWPRHFIVLYFGGAGAAGLAGWIYLKARQKTFPLPGESEPPPE